MNYDKLEIKKDKVDTNYKLYLFLKEINGWNWLTNNQISYLLEIIHSNSDLWFDKLFWIIEHSIYSKVTNFDKSANMTYLLSYLKNDEDILILQFALKLILIKDLLLSEAKIIVTDNLLSKNWVHPLSLEYDNSWKKNLYYTRVNWALISLLFFSSLENKKKIYLSESTNSYIENLIFEYHKLKEIWIEANQIFMIMFSESVNQSAVSSAWTSYEDRIFNLLVSGWLKPNEIKKIHDENDKSTEYDFFFEKNWVLVWIWAKRTLRERYKQFIKTSHTSEIDVTIEVTLWLDLTEEKAKTIIQHWTYIFVADEIYNSRDYLIGIDWIYPASEFKLDLILSLWKKKQ